MTNRPGAIRADFVSALLWKAELAFPGWLAESKFARPRLEIGDPIGKISRMPENAPRHELDADVFKRLRSIYTYPFGPGDKTRQAGLFFWLWDSLKDSCSNFSCRATKRYVGFDRGHRHLFAYIDFQKPDLKIGILADYADRLRLPDRLRQPFPAWNERGLVAMILKDEDPAILNALEQCYRWA